MKTKLILIFLLVSSITFAQKVKDNWVKFEYAQLPMKPLDKQIKSYQSKVISWEDEAAAKMQDQYEAELAAYRENYKIAHDQYKKELEDYNRKTRLEKIIDKELLEQNRPVFDPPPYPEFTELPRSPDNENLASKYLGLDGYEKGTYNPVFITVELKPFEEGETSKKSKTTGEGDKKKTTTTYYTKYKQPVKLTVESVINGILYDDVLPISTDFYTYSSKKTPTYKELKDFALNDLMSYTGKYINNNYGYRERSLNTSVVVIQKYKKHKYTAHEEALVHALSGYKNILLDKNKSISSFNKAINLWEKELLKYDPNNKKAKINREVAWYTMLNLAEAYLWIENYDKADELFSRMEIVVPKWNTKSRFKDSKNRLQDHKKRFMANQP